MRPSECPLTEFGASDTNKMPLFVCYDMSGLIDVCSCIGSVMFSLFKVSQVNSSEFEETKEILILHALTCELRL